ncbi:MAG: HD domain-containing protein [Campylobacterales bacterium]|nr:HD domain-containing protein [Campylobacterales bacterium]
MQPLLSEQLYMLLKLGSLISTKTNLMEILTILRDTGRDIVGADRCSIFVYDKETHTLWTKVAHGVEKITVDADFGVIGKAILSKEVQIVVDAYQDFRFNPSIDQQTGYVTRNIVAVPLLNYHGEPIGVFQALNKRDGVFTNIDAELLILIGNYASASLENAILYQKLQTSQIKIINKLTEAAEFKDNETSAHTKRVGLYSELVAHTLGRDEAFCQLLRITAPMHDIGKIGIPDSIIKKPGLLTNEELVVVKTHAMIGYNLLKDPEDEVLTMAANIARDHHEKVAGGGYPADKKGEEISLEGRIVAVTDVFDALTSRRPYKEPWSTERSLEYIEHLRGVQFDPDVVDAFLKNEEKIVEIRVHLED